MSIILGISAYYHDSAAALVVDGKIVAAAQEERFTRIKNTALFPANAVRYCLLESGLSINELDAIVFYDKPFLKFERLLEGYYAFAPKGLISFLKSIPIWLHEKLFLKKQLIDELKKIESVDRKKLKLLFSTHHLSHAASAFFTSYFNEAAILTIDGVGEWCTASIGVGKNNKIEFLKEMEFPHSVGLLYSAFTYYLGFKVNSGEYKLMGLAPYGNENDSETQHFIQIIKTHLVDIKKDGSIWLNQNYFSYTTTLKMLDEKKWKQLFGIEKRAPESALNQQHCNLAMAIQTVTEEIVMKMAVEAKRITGAEYLCMAGGVALNCVANGKINASGIFKEIYIQAAAGDAGGAIGAALAIHYQYFNNERILPSSAYVDEMQGAFLGPAFSDKEIVQMNKQTKAISQFYTHDADMYAFVAKKLAEGNIIGWFQGRMEFGPRALGHRSILADPRNKEMQQKLNLKIKFREGFRPFAPAILEEKVAEFFELENLSPYMLFTAPIQAKHRFALPDNYSQLSINEKLRFQRSSLQPITHVDFSARVQTVNKNINPKFWHLIDSFYQNTGVPILINTSFNVRGEPIVCSPFDAYKCFMMTDIDYLVLGNFVYSKSEQNQICFKEYCKRIAFVEKNQ